MLIALLHLVILSAPSGWPTSDDEQRSRAKPRNARMEGTHHRLKARLMRMDSCARWRHMARGGGRGWKVQGSAGAECTVGRLLARMQCGALTSRETTNCTLR